MAQITEVEASRRRKSPMRELLETLILALVVALLIRGFLFEVYRVDGSSMENTLRTREQVLVNKLIYHLRSPQPGDVIVFQYPKEPDRDFIKRVVAIAGDRIEMRGGQVYVNGELFPEVETVRMTTQNVAEHTVEPDSVWVLGDNRNNSEDSRYFGKVPLKNIRGLAAYRIWPLGRIGKLATPAVLPEQGR